MSQIIDKNLILTTNTAKEMSGLDHFFSLAQAANAESLRRITLLKMLHESSAMTGGYVHIDPELGCLPALIGNDARPVYLYEFVEAVDGLIDYDGVKGEFPTLNYAQISGAIAFLRKVSQHNARGIDIDALEDEADANDVELTNALRNALNDVETSCVLNND